MKIRVTVVFFLASLCLSACAVHKHSFSKPDCIHPATCTECGEIKGEPLGHTSLVGVCSRCRMIGNEELLAAINENFEHMMKEGTSLFSCLSGISDLDVDAQYEKFLKADQCTEAMACIYEKIITSCEKSDELNTIAYQTNLLKNACPPPISGGNEVSLANQGVLYQVYLQQLSSSCSYISESLAYLAGNGDHPTEIAYFEEVSEMPTPDSVIYGISYHSSQNSPSNIQYMYLLGDSKMDAILNYNLYLAAIEENTELKVEISDSMTILSRDGNMISIMMAGKDPSIGYFLGISFRDQ